VRQAAPRSARTLRAIETHVRDVHADSAGID